MKTRVKFGFGGEVIGNPPPWMPRAAILSLMVSIWPIKVAMDSRCLFRVMSIPFWTQSGFTTGTVPSSSSSIGCGGAVGASCFARKSCSARGISFRERRSCIWFLVIGSSGISMENSCMLKMPFLTSRSMRRRPAKYSGITFFVSVNIVCVARRHAWSKMTVSWASEISGNILLTVATVGFSLIGICANITSRSVFEIHTDCRRSCRRSRLKNWKTVSSWPT
mmetsp:Transcript_146394/g.469727  ORF Transcript_146394/g.469727 Transcript_146394/m.469727 type:complete len:222 (-) Transcript_146394:891-1556(-)